MNKEQGCFFSPALIICLCWLQNIFKIFIIHNLSSIPFNNSRKILVCENLKIKNGLSEISKKWLLLGIFWHIISERAPVRANICPTYVIHLISWLSVVLNLKKLKVNPDLLGLYWRVIQEQKWPFFADLSLRFAPDNSGLFSTVNLCQFESNQ